MSWGPLPAGEQDRRSTRLGWGLFVLFIGVFVTSVGLPQTALETEARTTMRALHFGISSLFLVLVVYRLYWWTVGPRPTPLPSMPAAAFGFARLLQLTLLMTLAVMGLSGFVYAWANGFEVRLAGLLPIPALVPVSQSAWLMSGYLHSGLAFYYLMLFGIALIMAITHRIRYGVPVRRIFPGRLA